MINKIKNTILQVDRFLFKKFGSDKGIQFLQSIKEVRVLFSYLNDSDNENQVRFVGGCVRKSFHGEVIDDIDLATSLKPEEIKKKLQEKNITIIDTGIEHGTLTVILNKKKFEITTLRKDVLTDGRHADVKFTLNWKEDAERRDFTINAIYVDVYGRIFDPMNGIKDLERGEVKFIGEASERIQEDYLRILRYFRFFLQYSKFDHRIDVIKSIKKNINGINKISNERIFDELKKILVLKNFYSLFYNHSSKEIISNIFPQFKYYERLNKLNSFSENFKKKYDKYLILALLIVDQSKSYEYFCHKYKTSNNLKKRFEDISRNFNDLKNKSFFSYANVKKLIYLTSKEKVLNLLLFSVLIKKTVVIEDVEKLIHYINIYKVPKFPISGEYLKMHGYKPGPKLGRKLKSLENEWLKNNFILDKKFLEKSLKN